ncbi:MAG: general stress protein CsbD [Lutibacter sp.]|jgi:uncharacterized protein YjbJ (UPF0337 family)|nr:general stress protein CsbD [Lutibacter sp.]
MRNSKELRNNWQEIRKNLKEKFAKLTDNDLLFAENQKREMIKRLQQKYGLSKEEIHKIFSDI